MAGVSPWVIQEARNSGARAMLLFRSTSHSITGSGRIEKGGTQHDSLDQSVRQVRTNLPVLSLDGDVTSF